MRRCICTTTGTFPRQSNHSVASLMSCITRNGCIPRWDTDRPMSMKPSFWLVCDTVSVSREGCTPGDSTQVDTRQIKRLKPTAQFEVSQVGVVTGPLNGLPRYAWIFSCLHPLPELPQFVLTGTY